MELYNPGAPFHYTSPWNPTRVHPVTGVIKPHRGEDWGAPSGTPIPAAGAGKVVYKGVMNGYGNVVVLEHANGSEIVHTLYAHMHTATPLAVGSSVAEGGAVGPCGNTGIGTGSHLHFEVLRNGTKGHPNLVAGHATVNPREFDISNLTHPDNATPVSPAPSAAPAESVKASGSWQFPIRKAGGAQFKDAEELFNALEVETSGHYLLGSNKFWHGGIHITNASAPQCVLNEPIRCMADGEVIAYRLNDDYLESTFGSNEKKLKYSNSFCLVRHEYTSPPNPEEGPNKGKQNKLNFYSLYMHLLPYKRYPLSEDEKPKPKVTMTVNDFKAYDDFPESSSIQSPGKLSAATKLEVLEQRSVNNVTYAKGKILSGSVKNGSHKVRGVGKEVWFAYLKDGVPYQNSKPKRIWLADDVPERAKPNYWQGKVKATAVNKLDLYGEPTTPQNGQPAGDRLGTMQLIPGSVVEFDSTEVLNLNVAGTIRRMAKCTKVSGDVAATGYVPDTFWACVENAADYRMLDWTSLTPASFDSVVTTSTGIKAGDPIGYLGRTENLLDESGVTDSKFQVHIEIFTAEADVKDFLDNRAGLKIGKQYLHLPVGIKLKNKAPATGTTDPLKKEHAIDLSEAPILKEGTDDWYDVHVVGEDQPVSGLIKKSDAKMISQHDWTKLGFRIVEESSASADGFLDPEDMPQFFKDLFTKIDKNGNGDVDPSELADALKDADTRSQWSKLIARHPTEWRFKADNAKWSRLEKILETAPKSLKHEKERIDSLVFWEELSEKPKLADGMVWHFHPIGFLGNFLSSSCIPLDKAKEIALLVTSGYEGKDKLDYEALADNTDQQGTSFGIIQWNFGQGTLGPLLLAMRAANQQKFDSSFGANMNFQSLLSAMTSANIPAQKSWAQGVISNNRAGWTSAFTTLGQIEEFKKVQLDFAAHYQEKIKSCIALMRELAPHLMVKVQLRTYCALFDLCVQQNNLTSAETLIRTEFASASITTQKELLVFVCKKRAEKALEQYRADAFSRRMGIISGQQTTITMSGHTKTKENKNFSAIIEGDVCEI